MAATTRSRTDERINRLRRDASDEVGNVVSYLEEGSGKPSALHGTDDEGPRVKPIGDTPYKSEHGSFFTDLSLTAIYQTADYEVDVRSWRTMNLGITYLAGNAASQLLILFTGTYSPDGLVFRAPAVIDATLNTVGGETGVRTVLASRFSSAGTGVDLITDLPFDVNTYDAVTVSVREVGGAPFGTISLDFRLIR